MENTWKIQTLISYFSFHSFDTFPNKESLGTVQETETEIIFNTDGLKKCNSFAKLKILFKIEQLNPDQKFIEVTYKEDQRKGDLSKEVIKPEKIRVSMTYSTLYSSVLNLELCISYFRVCLIWSKITAVSKEGVLPVIS